MGVQRLRRSCRGRDEKVQSLYGIEATVAIASNRDHLRMSGLPGAEVQLQNVQTRAHQRALSRKSSKSTSTTITQEEDSDLHRLFRMSVLSPPELQRENCRASCPCTFSSMKGRRAVGSEVL